MTALSSLEISVGVMPSASDTLSIEPELELIKPALLYGDSTRLYSPHIQILEHLDRQGSLTAEELFVNFQTYSKGGDLTEEERSMTHFLNYMESLRAKSHTTRNEQMLVDILAEYKENLREVHRRDVMPEVQKYLRSIGYFQIRKAARAGLLTVTQLIDDPTLIGAGREDALLRAYFHQVERIVADLRSYPLFDEFSVDIVRALVTDGKLPPSVLASPHAAHTGIASQLMRATPTFPKATVYDILDIRKELKRPLTRFRQYVVELGDLTREPAFGPEFEAAVQDLIMCKINPALEEIDEAIQTNRPLKKLVRQSVGSTETMVRNVLLLGLSQVSHLSLIIGAIAVGAQTVASTVNDMISTNQDIQRRKVYFLHALERGLEQRYK